MRSPRVLPDPARSTLHTRRSGRWRGLLLRALLTAAVLLGIALWLPLREIAAAAGQTGAGLWLTILAGTLACHGVAAWKWQLLLRASGARTRLGDALAAHGAGLFANNWLPSVVGGDVVRAGLLARRRHGLAVPVAAGVADRVIDLAASLLLAALGALLAQSRSTGSALPLLRGATALLALGVGIGSALLWTWPPERLPRRLEPALARLKQAFAALVRRPATTGAALLLSLLVQAALVALNARLGRAVGIEVGGAAWLLAFPLAKIAALAPVSLGGLGVREAAQAALLAPFGAAAAPALAEAFVWRTELLALGLLGGALSGLLTRGRDS